MRRVVAILLLSLFFCSGFIKAPQQLVTAVEYPDSTSSLFLYTEGIKRNTIYRDTMQARSLFQRVIEQDSTFAPAHYELAANLLYEQTPKAIIHARRAMELDSTNSWYRQLYGQALLIDKRYNEALPVFEQLVRTERNPDHFRLLAALYERDNRPFSAIAILDSAERQFGVNPYLGEMKRQLLLSTHQFDRALVEAEKMVENIPYAPENHIALGEIYALMKRDSLAEDSFRKAIEVDPSSIMAWFAIGEYYHQRGDSRAYLNAMYHLFTLNELPLKEKINILEQLTSNLRFYRENYPQIDILVNTLYNAHPEDKKVMGLYAGHLIGSGKMDKALELFKVQTRTANADKDAFMMVMEIENYLERPDSVMLYLNRALERFPKDAELHLQMGQFYLVNNDNDAAIKKLKEALKCAENDKQRSMIWGNIGDVYHQISIVAEGDDVDAAFGSRSQNKRQRKNMTRCYDCYDKALVLYADNVNVLNNYAYFLSLEERDLELALQMAEKATSLSENNPTYLDTWAWVLHKLGRNDEAKRIMRQAISLDASNSAELQLHYGDILAALGEKFMAEIYWRKALDNGYDKHAIEERIERLKQQ